MVEPKDDSKIVDDELLLEHDDEEEEKNDVVQRMMIEDPDSGDKTDRLGFIRKVYGILSCQLIVTALGITAVQLDPDLHAWMSTQNGLALGLFLISFIVEIVIICWRDMARRVPANYILLSIFTIC